MDAIIDHNIGAGRVVYNPTMVTNADLEGAISAAGGDGHHEYSGTLVAVES
jgi:hypothetical protein